MEQDENISDIQEELKQSKREAQFQVQAQSNCNITSFNVPPPVASSANQTCLVPVGCNSCISGIMPTVYILIARGSPCMVPSFEAKISPLT